MLLYFHVVWFRGILYLLSDSSKDVDGFQKVRSKYFSGWGVLGENNLWEFICLKYFISCCIEGSWIYCVYDVSMNKARNDFCRGILVEFDVGHGV